MDKDLKEVVIHETGHFVASTLNNKLFKIGDGVESILIYKENSSSVYTGCTRYKGRGKGFYSKISLENTPYYISELVYGCIFEYFHMRNKSSDYKFESCFSLKNSSSGRYDHKQYSNIIKNNYVSSKIYSFVRNEYTNTSKFRQDFDLVENLKIEKFLIKKGDFSYEVDLSKLQKKLNDFLIKHEPTYISFIDTLNELFKK